MNVLTLLKRNKLHLWYTLTVRPLISPCFLTGLHTNLNEQHALGLKVQTQAMALVVQKVLQTKELDCAQVPPIPPVHTNVQLSGLNKDD